MAEWNRIVHTTTKKFLKEQEINVLRNRKLLALLREKGRISFNHSGESLDWKVRYKRAPLQGYADNDTLSFPRRNRWKTAGLPWRGYAATDAMTKKERLMNKSKEAIVKIYDETTKLLLEDVEENFGDELYIDGNATGNSSRLHGLESFMATNGTVTISDGTQRSANAADKNGFPNDTYAGLSTALGNYGGSWSGSWPTGTGHSHYDFWSPNIVCYNSTAFTGTGDTWATQGNEALRYGILKSQKNKSRKGSLDMVLLESTLYEQFLMLLDSKERWIAKAGKTEGSLAKLGFLDTINYDGVEVTWEYGMPANVGYGFNVDEMELMSLQDQLFVPLGPDFDISTSSWRFAIDFYGNAKFNPRHFLKLMTIAA